MKILGTSLILVGIVCFAIPVTGLPAWLTPVPGEPSPAAIASVIGGKLLLFYVAGTACIIGGVAALVAGIREPRFRKRPGLQAGIRRLVTVILVTLTVLVCAVFATFKVMTRWDPDEEWAAKVIEESSEIRLTLEAYRQDNGEFPPSLSEIEEDYTRPTDFLTRHGAAPDTTEWFYDRIGADNYQLFAPADSWGSRFDAMVYRHTGEFTDPWSATRASSRSIELGNWRYIRGFSRFCETYYFDAAGDIHSRYP